VRIVVLMVRVEVAVLPLAGVTLVGAAAQVVSVGRPLQLRATAALNPDTEFMVTVTPVDFPATTVAEVGLIVKPKLGAAAPVPLNCTVCGLLAALSGMVSKPVARPTDVGVNVTLIVQVP
jgi:hypothetical protein